MVDNFEMRKRLRGEWQSLVERLIAAGTSADAVVETMFDVSVECAPVGGQGHAAVLTRRWAC